MRKAMQQLPLWGEEPPGTELIGKQVIYGKGRRAVIVGIAAHTAEYGTMYRLKVEGEQHEYLAYSDQFEVLGGDIGKKY